MRFLTGFIIFVSALSLSSSILAAATPCEQKLVMSADTYFEQYRSLFQTPLADNEIANLTDEVFSIRSIGHD
jgi:hypothetical protein